MQSDNNARRAVRQWKARLVVGVLILLYVAAAFFLVAEQSRDEQARAQETAKNEIDLLVELAGKYLRLGDYQEVDALLDEWGKSRPKTTLARVVAANAVLLGEYQREAKSERSLTLERSIEYGYSGRATLVLSLDISELDHRHQAFVARLTRAGILFTLVLFILSHLLLRQREKSIKLAEQREELDRANKALRAEMRQRQEIERERDRMIGIVEAAPDFISMADPDGKLLYLNQGGRVMSGLGERPIDELRIADMHPQWATDLILGEGIPAALRNGSWFGETALLGENSKEIPVSQIILSHHDEQGRLLHLSTIIRDISKRKQAERELKQLNEELEARVARRTASLREAKDEAERANAAKSEFLSRMSHELRTPLNAILGFGQLLETDSEQPLSARQLENVTEILRGGRHLLEMINEVLDLSRIESGRLNIDLQALSVGPLMESCVRQVQPLARQRHIDVVIEPSGDCHAQVDPVRFRQVLLNLLSNAIKYNREGGKVRVCCAAVGGQHLRISVQDTGQGIPAASLPRLFRPFERLESAYEGVEGSGIGLALAKRLVQAMHGDIGVESVSDEGSTFWFELPLAKGDVAAHQEAASTMTGPGNLTQAARKLLCVEDNPANLRLVRKIIESRSNFELLDAATAEVGLEIAARERPDLILLDINLPGMDGFEALRRLKQDDATRDIPVIAVTANAMPRDVERGKVAGFADYLTKPLDVGKFLEVLDQLLHASKDDSL